MAEPGRFIMDIGYMVVNKRFLLYNPQRKNQQFFEILCCLKASYECGNKLPTRARSASLATKVTIQLRSKFFNRICTRFMTVNIKTIRMQTFETPVNDRTIKLSAVDVKQLKRAFLNGSMFEKRRVASLQDFS